MLGNIEIKELNKFTFLFFKRVIKNNGTVLVGKLFFIRVYRSCDSDVYVCIIRAE